MVSAVVYLGLGGCCVLLICWVVVVLWCDVLLRAVRFVYCDFCCFAVGVRVGCMPWYCCFVLAFFCSFGFVWLVGVSWD